MSSVEDILHDAVANKRVCPMPSAWNHLWEMLPGRHRVGHSWEPAPPLILAAWWEASNRAKRERFRLHLQWAQDHGVLDEAASYLATLRPEDWYTEE